MPAQRNKQELENSKIRERENQLREGVIRNVLPQPCRRKTYSDQQAHIKTSKNMHIDLARGASYNKSALLSARGHNKRRHTRFELTRLGIMSLELYLAMRAFMTKIWVNVAGLNQLAELKT